MKYKDSLCVNADGSAVDLATVDLSDKARASQQGKVVEFDVYAWIGSENRILYDSFGQAYQQSFCTLVSREGCISREEWGEGLEDKKKESCPYCAHPDPSAHCRNAAGNRFQRCIVAEEAYKRGLESRPGSPRLTDGECASIAAQKDYETTDEQIAYSQGMIDYRDHYAAPQLDCSIVDKYNEYRKSVCVDHNVRWARVEVGLFIDWYNEHYAATQSIECHGKGNCDRKILSLETALAKHLTAPQPSKKVVTIDDFWEAPQPSDYELYINEVGVVVAQLEQRGLIDPSSTIEAVRAIQDFIRTKAQGGSND